MRVLLQGRSARSIAVNPGGDQVKLEETVEALRDLGVDAEASAELEPDLDRYDLAHLFGVVRPQEAWVQAKNAQRQRKPFVLSTVYCDVWPFERDARTGPVGFVARHTNRDTVEALKAAGRGVRQREWSKGSLALFRRGYSNMIDDLLAATSALLPDSRSEWLRMAADFGLAVEDPRVFVVPNGFESRSTHQVGSTPPAHLERYKGSVLCVARLEARKNQPNLIAACAGTELQLVMAGPATANQPGYVRTVEDMAHSNDNVSWLGPVSAEEKAWLYELASVHVLPSWMETTGLSSLEAATAGCAIVVSPNGDTRDYFGDHATYCDPGDPKSILAAIRIAAANGHDAALESLIREEFTWEKSARRTIDAYEFALSPGQHAPHGQYNDRPNNP